MDQFAHRLKNCRERKKEQDPLWTQRYVAEQIGMARTTYTAYENGTKMPPADTINHIAQLLDVSNDYLMGRTDKMNYDIIEEETFQLIPVVKTIDSTGRYKKEDIVKMSPVASDKNKISSLVWLLVPDNQMIQAGIRQNSQVLIELHVSVKSGDVVALAIGYEHAIIRKVYCNEETITLINHHKDGSDETYHREEITLIGKVILVQSSLET